MTMNCDDARALIIDRLMDELAAEDRRRLEAHLAECPACRAADRELAEVWDSLGALAPPPSDAGLLIRFGRRLERQRSRVRVRGSLQAAAAVALLLAGGLLGRTLTPGVEPGPTGVEIGPPAGPQYLLLLRGDEPDRTRPAAQLFEEYSEWASSLAAAGALVVAEALDSEDSRWVPPTTETDRLSTPVTGFFLVEAPSYDSAVAIARASPHAAYGGLVEIRQIVRGR